MYVCVCKKVRERDLEKHLKASGSSLFDIQKSCGAGTECGSCVNRLKCYLEAASPVESESAELIQKAE